MSYVKLPKVTSDYAVGFQSVNQARDNNTALLAQLDAKHSTGTNGQSPPGRPFEAVGRHDDIVIARTVAHFTVDALVVPTRLRQLVSGPMLPVLVAQELKTGQWQIFVSTPHVFWAHATPSASASVSRKANAYLTQSPDQGPSVIVTTWEQDAGSWTPSYFDFSLVFWAKRY